MGREEGRWEGRREGGGGSGEVGKRTVSSENPVDTHYKGLDVNLDALDSGDSDFKVSLREHGPRGRMGKGRGEW